MAPAFMLLTAASVPKGVAGQAAARFQTNWDHARREAVAEAGRAPAEAPAHCELAVIGAGC